RLAIEILHDEVVDLLVTADIMDGADVRMRQHPNRTCLALESRAPVGIGRESFRQDLDRDGAIQTRVAGFVDLAHAAGAAGRGAFIRAESSAGGEGQTLLWIIRAGCQRGRDYSWPSTKAKASCESFRSHRLGA